MQNKIEYEIKKLFELNHSQVEQAVAIFINGFYYIYAKAVSRDKTLLKELFIDAFDYDMVFVCLYEDRVVGFLGLGNSHKRCVALSKEICKRLFGNIKGAMIYMQMGGILHEITVHEINEGYIDYITTDDNHRGKGIATHASPAQPILAFIKQIKRLQKPIPTFLFTTCGLYSANTLRIFAKHCKDKNVIPVMGKSYRCAATDGTLIAPFMNVWFHHEKKLYKKVKRDVNDFTQLLSKPLVSNVPRFKIYSILNYPNKFFGQKFSPLIYTHKENCILCGKCIKDCPTQNIQKDNSGYPIIKRKNCIHCYRCIHHCPKKALSLSIKHLRQKHCTIDTKIKLFLGVCFCYNLFITE